MFKMYLFIFPSPFYLQHLLWIPLECPVSEIDQSSEYAKVFIPSKFWGG